SGERVGLRLEYVVESPPLGTAGALGAIGQGCDEPLLVVNGDLLTDLDFGELYRRHLAGGAAATIGAVRRQSRIDFGLLEVTPAGDLAAYREKPVLEHLVSMGVNVVGPRALALIRPGERLDMPDLHLRALAAGERVACHVAECLWLDIGRPDDYE